MSRWNETELFAQIFEWQWMIRMPAKWALKETDLTLYGIPTSGNLEYDAELYEEWVKTTRTIAELAELQDEGKEFIIPEIKDTERMFRIVMDYTGFVADRLNQTLDLNFYKIDEDETLKEVLNDVVKLQNFANKIHPIMLEYIPEEEQIVTTGLLGFINQRSRSGGLKRLNFDPIKRLGFNYNPATQEIEKVDTPEVVTAEDEGAIRMKRMLDQSSLTRLRKMI